MKYTYSSQKQALIDSINSKPLQIGDIVNINRKHFDKFARSQFVECCKIIEISQTGDQIKIISEQDGRSALGTWVDTIHVEGKHIYQVGVNPFPSSTDRIKSISYTLDSVLFNLNVLHERKHDEVDGMVIPELNWNPVVIDSDGNPYYYQRDFVWTLRDEQLLVESIYNNIACGKILVRKRFLAEISLMYKTYGINQLGWADIVDGKQRLNAIYRFVNDEFTDLKGNYYSDLSNVSQRRFRDHQLISYAEMPENTPDVDVLEQFLKVNFAGVPQSKEHMEYVNKLYSKFK